MKQRIHVKKGTHNRPYYGQWHEYGKEWNKWHRKLMKGIRHKLLFHIPLDESEEEIVKQSGLTENSPLDRQGFVKRNNKTDKWRFMNPKESNQNND